MKALCIALLLVMAAACSNTETSGDGGALPPSDTHASSGGASLDAGNTGAGASDATTTLDGSGSDGATSNGQIAARKCVAAGQGECDEHSECNSEQYCDPCLRKCLAPRQPCDPCTTDVQCSKAEHGSACLTYASGGTFCGLACQSDVGCPKGFSCKQVSGLKPPQDKQCVPKTGSCGKSAGSCTSDADCPFSKICNPDFGACIKGCASKEECPAGKVCSLFRCAAPCTADADCTKLAKEAKCESTGDQKGVCKIPGGCLGPPDCPEKATYCDVTDHKCKPGCKIDADCKETAKKCEAGSCVDKGCTANWECAFEQVCELSTGKCKKAEGKFCAKCDPQDKAAVACGGAPHKCFSLQDKDGKKLGDYCAIACGTAPGGPCPQGYQCQEVPDQNGKPQGKFCMRQCWQSPFPDEG